VPPPRRGQPEPGAAGPSPQEPDGLRACDDPADCVAVRCGCSCSGCGGFDYDDAVNRRFESWWYEAHDCQKSRICPMVCCPKRALVCDDGRCTVVGRGE
jgi:hypothetical protein